jgi:RNA polymerase sigma factor (sigma-70 family)
MPSSLQVTIPVAGSPTLPRPPDSSPEEGTCDPITSLLRRLTRKFEVQNFWSAHGHDRQLREEAYEEVVRKYLGELRHHALWVAGGNYHAAEEAIQEAMIAVFDDWPKVLWVDNPVSYLKKIVKNKTIDIYRRDGKFVLVPATDDFSILDQESKDPSALALDREAWNNVRQLVDRLPGKQRMVMYLYLDGMPMADLSECLGIKLSTARVHLMRARETLRQIVLEKHGETPAEEQGQKDRARQLSGAA